MKKGILDGCLFFCGRAPCVVLGVALSAFTPRHLAGELGACGVTASIAHAGVSDGHLWL